MSEMHRITVDPNQCGGRPCLRSLRIRVKDVLDLLAAGATREEILVTTQVVLDSSRKAQRFGEV